MEAPLQIVSCRWIVEQKDLPKKILIQGFDPSIPIKFESDLLVSYQESRKSGAFF